jgi:hypothetical protein
MDANNGFIDEFMRTVRTNILIILTLLAELSGHALDILTVLNQVRVSMKKKKT